MVSILGANSVSGGYEVSNSLRFNDDDGPSLQRTPSSAGNRAVWTWSAWLKINPLGTLNIFTAGGWSAGQDGTGLALINGQFYSYWNTPSSPTISSAFFRDPSAWYHVVLQANTSTLKVFVNGVEHSSKSISGDGAINNTNEMVMGRYSNTTGGNMDGYMTEINFVDGTAKAATDFGEYNDNGVWIPKKYTGSYGTNGFFLQFKQTGTSQNSSGIGADTSGQDNHFAVTNLAALDVTEDTCTNNFMTLNPLSNYYQQSTFSEGNTKTVTATSPYAYDIGTIGLTQGKWYWEIKPTGSSGSDTVYVLGVSGQQVTANSQQLGQGAYEWGWYAIDGNIRHNGGSASGWSNVTYTTNNIIGIAMDLDNNKIYWSKNGTFQNSGDPTSGSTGTGAVALTDPASVSLGAYFIAVSYYDSGGQGTFECNFGNPSFSISSGNADANGYGNFEYAPPSGYYALCTKNLAEFG